MARYGPLLATSGGFGLAPAEPKPDREVVHGVGVAAFGGTLIPVFAVFESALDSADHRDVVHRTWICGLSGEAPPLFGVLEIVRAVGSLRQLGH